MKKSKTSKPPKKQAKQKQIAETCVTDCGLPEKSLCEDCLEWAKIQSLSGSTKNKS